jgi:hypothetical protein
MGLASEIHKGGADAGDFILANRSRLTGERGIHEASFNCPSAALAPESGSHFFDHGQLDLIDRAEMVQIAVEDLIKALP